MNSGRNSHFSIILITIFILLAMDRDSCAEPEYGFFMGICVTPKMDTSIILRKLAIDSPAQFLVVHPYTLKTALVSESKGSFTPCTWEDIKREFPESMYVLALKSLERNGTAIRTAGINRFPHQKNCVDITADLCPARLPLDRSLFKILSDELDREFKPIPISIAITGLWMKGHPRDLEWIKDQEKKGEFAITWINHTYSHGVCKGQPVNEKFLLGKNTNVSDEILALERILIENGLTPSVFFRFPALRTDPGLFKTILYHGLIPVGSDAWIGKGQDPKQGSIILLHANGNEPEGIERFKTFLKQNKRHILSRQWELSDIRKSLEYEILDSYYQPEDSSVMDSTRR